MNIQDAPLAIGFDIGGTNLRAAVVTSEGVIVDTMHIRSHRDETSMEDAIVGMTMKLQSVYDVEAVGIAVAGFLDPDCEIVQFAPHLPWRDAPVRARIAERIDIPVRLEHDANSAAWGEYRFGAAQGAGTWVLFAIGTGIGATLMHNGEIYRGSFGVAPELGHLSVVPHGRPCSCGKRGCLERYCSGTALAFTALELLESEPGSHSPLMTMAEFTGEDVMHAARGGDPLSLRAVADFSEWLGLGLSIVGDVFDPELIVVGGGVSKNADLFLETASQRGAELMVGSAHRRKPRISVASLGAEAGMVGVADLARRAAK